MDVPAGPLRDSIDKELTYSIPKYRPDLPPDIIHNMRIMNKNVISIPKGRIDLIPEDFEVIDRTVSDKVEFPKFKFDLREDQQNIYDQVKGSCIVNAPPSWGKTFTGLAIAEKLGCKTFVSTHTVRLRRQWEIECKKVFGITPGIVGSGEFNTDAPIVIGNIQTAVNSMPELAKKFGTLIVDEMHHVPAKTFTKFVDSSHASNIIGLSATIKRKDGHHVIFPDYFGPKVLKAARNNAMDPSVDIIKLPIVFPEASAWANRITELCDIEEFRNYIAAISKAYAMKGHKVLTVGQRVNFLKACARKSGEKAISITGAVSNEETDMLAQNMLNGTYNEVFATQSIFSEGISINPLSALILANPINNDYLLEQLIGRIERIMKDKMNPVIVDIHLKGRTVERQASNRINYYMKKGYKINFISW